MLEVEDLSFVWPAFLTDLNWSPEGTAERVYDVSWLGSLTLGDRF